MRLAEGASRRGQVARRVERRAGEREQGDEGHGASGSEERRRRWELGRGGRDRAVAGRGL